MARQPPARSILFVLLLTSIWACEDSSFDPEDPFFEPKVRPVERAIGTAIPIAYAATLARAAFDGEATDCVTLSTPCTDTPCSAVAVIEINDECPLPLSENATGFITVVGTETTQSTGAYAAVFTDVFVNGRKLIIKSVDFFGVSPFTDDRFVGLPSVQDGFRITYGDFDLEMEGEEFRELTSTLWTIDVATMGTPGDPRDDLMKLNGARQAAESGGPYLEASQTALSQTIWDATCPRNPISGTAIMQKMDQGDVVQSGETFLSFHDECDGNAIVAGSLGVTAPSTFTTVGLDLLNASERN